MTSYIDLIKFKKILSNHQIELFDHDLRISHHRLCYVMVNSKQAGGSGDFKNNTNKLEKISQIHLLHLVNALLEKNNQKINWILSIY
jgi:hypothetical protein